MRDRKTCHERGGFWYTYGIHAQDWIPCSECDDEECPHKEKKMGSTCEWKFETPPQAPLEVSMYRACSGVYYGRKTKFCPDCGRLVEVTDSPGQPTNEIDSLKKRIMDLEDALHHYADESLYFPRSIVLECQEKGVRLAPIYSDFGETAAKALHQQPSQNVTKSDIIEILEEVVQDFAEAGCRHDLNPTMDMSGRFSTIDWALKRFKSMDDFVRNRAKDALARVKKLKEEYLAKKEGTGEVG